MWVHSRSRSCRKAKVTRLRSKLYKGASSPYQLAWGSTCRRFHLKCKRLLVSFTVELSCVKTCHPWLSRIPASVGSQEVVEHTHKLSQLIGRCLCRCRLGHQFIIISDPTCTTIYYPTCTYLLSEVWKPLKIASLPATQRVQEFLITQGDIDDCLTFHANLLVS